LPAGPPVRVNPDRAAIRTAGHLCEGGIRVPQPHDAGPPPAQLPALAQRPRPPPRRPSRPAPRTCPHPQRTRATLGTPQDQSRMTRRTFVASALAERENVGLDTGSEEADLECAVGD